MVGHQRPSVVNAVAELGEAEDRAVAADEEAAELAVAAQADAAGHVPLERDPGPVAASMPRSRSDVDRGLHHPLRPADEGDGFAAVPARARSKSWVTTPTAPEPVRPGAVDGLGDLDVSRRAASAPSSATNSRSARRPRAVGRAGSSPNRIALGEAGVDQRPRAARARSRRPR